jgi:predicted metal-dependent RNase
MATPEFLGAAGTVTGSKHLVELTAGGSSWTGPLECADVRLARTAYESRAINAVTGPVLIISASGMATGGWVLHHLRQRLSDSRTTVLLVGYQAIGTRSAPGRRDVGQDPW